MGFAVKHMTDLILLPAVRQQLQIAGVVQDSIPWIAFVETALLTVVSIYMFAALPWAYHRTFSWISDAVAGPRAKYRSFRWFLVRTTSAALWFALGIYASALALDAFRTDGDGISTGDFVLDYLVTNWLLAIAGVVTLGLLLKARADRLKYEDNVVVYGSQARLLVASIILLVVIIGAMVAVNLNLRSRLPEQAAVPVAAESQKAGD